MNSLESIVRNNKEAVKLGVRKDGSTTESRRAAAERRKAALEVQAHDNEHGGLRGHSIGHDYPFSVVLGIEYNEVGASYNSYTVVNLLTGKSFTTFYQEHPGDTRASDDAHDYASWLAQNLRSSQAAERFINDARG